MRLWYHPESDSLFLDEPGEWQNTVDGALCNDVTGIAAYERLAVLKGVRNMGIDRGVIRPTAIGGARLDVAFVQKMLDLAPPGMPLVRSCITCDKFVENTEQCTEFKSRPPARVIAYGCPKYDNDDVPF